MFIGLKGSLYILIPVSAKAPMVIIMVCKVSVYITAVSPPEIMTQHRDANFRPFYVLVICIHKKYIRKSADCITLLLVLINNMLRN